MHATSCRRGFTLVELLVVIAIIGILVSLLLPAVQAAREAARRTQCSNNLKQAGLALHNYHTAHNTLPAGAYYVDAGLSDVRYHGHTWMGSLLPYIEQQPVYDRLDFRLPNDVAPNATVLNDLLIKTLLCPSDPHAGLLDNARLNGDYTPGGGGTRSMGASYVPSGGPMHMNVCTLPALAPNINCLGNNGQGNPGHSGGSYESGAPGMFAGGPTAYRFSDCRDGLSNTFLLGEQLPAYASLMHYFSSHLNVGSTNTPPNYHGIYTDCPPRLTAGSDPYNPHLCVGRMGGFKSEHPGGVSMCLGDGSVRFVNETIDYETWQYAGNRSDGEVLGAF